LIGEFTAPMSFKLILKAVPVKSKNHCRCASAAWQHEAASWESDSYSS
jgi:hypothetical protein